MSSSLQRQHWGFSGVLAMALILSVAGCSTPSADEVVSDSIAPEVGAEQGEETERIPLSYSLSSYHQNFEPRVSLDGQTAAFFEVAEEDIQIGADLSPRLVITSLTLVDLDDLEKRVVIELPGPGLGAQFLSGEPFVFIQSSNPYWHYVVNLRDRTLQDRITVPLLDPTFSPDGKYAIGREISGKSDGPPTWPTLYSILDGKKIASFPEMGGGADFRFSPDGNRILVSGWNSEMGRSGLLIGELGQLDNASWIDLTGEQQEILHVEGNVILVRGSDGTYSLINTSVSTEIPVLSQSYSLAEGAAEITIGDIAISSNLTFSPSGSYAFNGELFLDTGSGNVFAGDLPTEFATMVTLSAPTRTLLIDFPNNRAFDFDWEKIDITSELEIDLPAAGRVEAVVGQQIVVMEIEGEPGQPATVTLTTFTLDQSVGFDQQSSERAPEIPSDYEDLGDGVAGKFGAQSCTSSDQSCWWVEAYVYQDCPKGGFIELEIFDDQGRLVAFSSEFFFPLLEGSAARVELENPIAEGVGARFSDGFCL